MKLELHRVRIDGLRWGDATKVDGTVLQVCKAELLEALGQDERLASVDADLACPDRKSVV